ncbi:MAG: hypothetical protein HQK52_04810 [Oligoflexia bacterium]|nr:hypothetical protein [Oligoflexia bacterium]
MKMSRNKGRRSFLVSVTTLAAWAASVIGITIGSSSPLWAGPFKTTITSYGNVPAVLYSEIDALMLSLESEVNKRLPDTSNGSTYLKGMSNASVIALKGIGVDYASAPDIFVVGAGVGVGADVGNASLSKVVGGDIDARQLRGFGAAASVMAGVNLAVFPFMPTIWVIDLKRMQLFMNFWKMDVPKFDSSLSGELTSFGFHLQYKLMDGIKVPIFLRWGGIDFTTGFDYSTMDILFVQDLNKSASRVIPSVAFGNPTANANFIGRASAGANVKVRTIPIELSTHVQLLYVLTLFGGLGADFNSGGADANARLNGTIAVSDNLGTINGVTANAALDLGSHGTPSSINTRWFLGGQLNVTLLKVYAQINHGIGQDTWGVNAGVRIAY